MDAREGLCRLQGLLARALTAPDPALPLGAAGDLPEDLRRAVEAIDRDGLRIAAVLVAQLRFARLIQGSAKAGEWFADDPAGFSHTFRAYHHAVPPAEDPWGEAQSFHRWIAEE